jgi:invasion protein IalB
MSTSDRSPRPVCSGAGRWAGSSLSRPRFLRSVAVHLAALLFVVGPVAALAQDGGGEGQGQGAGQAKAPPWVAHCTAPARDGPLDCQMEQRAVVTQTGQLLILVTVRVPAETRKPVMAIQVPLSLNLQAGISIDIDGQNATKLDYQTCDGQGCYAGMPISDAFLQAMFKGLKLNVTIQNLDKQTLTVPMSLASFTDFYGRVR